jgi:peptidyl-lysine (3S)-dioxygenase / protease
MDESVSSLHKDPYENFYLPIVGEKHFTLLPPHSILRLEEQEFRTARWNYQEGKFTCHPTGGNNRWICCNPDLKEDHERFPLLA